jgi:hypothetical protein
MHLLLLHLAVPLVPLWLHLLILLLLQTICLLLKHVLLLLHLSLYTLLYVPETDDVLLDVYATCMDSGHATCNIQHAWAVGSSIKQKHQMMRSQSVITQLCSHMHGKWT